MARLSGNLFSSISRVSLKQIAVCSLFVLNALAFIIIAALNPRIMIGDGVQYIALADGIVNGYFGAMTANGFEPEGVRSFGYPVFLLISYGLFGESKISVIILQGFLYIVSLLMIWKLVKQIFGEEVSFVFLILSLIYPFIAYASSMIAPENPCIFLIALSVFALDFLIRKNAMYTGFALAGFFLALTMYFRSNLFPLPFFLALIFLFVLKINRKTVLLFVVAAALTMLPATIYNYRNFGVITPTPVYGGAAISLWMATWHARVSTEDILKYTKKNEVTDALASSGIFEQVAETNRKIGLREDFFPINMGFYDGNEKRAQVQDEYLKVAVENIKSTPGVYLKNSLKNAFRMWFSAYIGFENFPLPLSLYILFIGISVFLIGLVGMLLAVKNFPDSLFVVTAAGTMIFHSITLCWLHTEARYTSPARFFLLAFAGYAIFRFYKLMRNYIENRI